MKVTNCIQNNLPKQSFGMKIKFHPDDVALGVIPQVEKMIDVLTKVNANKEVAEIAPAEVRLHYKGAHFANEDDALSGTPSHKWHLEFQDFKPKVVLSYETSSVQELLSRFARKALDFADSIVEQKIQRVEKAAKIVTNAQKIKDAGLV